MDENLKKLVEVFCSDIGMTMTTAFCILHIAKTAVRKQKIPFEISTDPFYSASNICYLEKKMFATPYATVKFFTHRSFFN